MINDRFISIGSKGCSFPIELTELEPPLTVGVNSIRWAGRASDPIGLKAHAWVSKNVGETFEIYPLAEAIKRKRVQHFQNVRWRADGTTYNGDGFFPTNWSPKSGQPQLVALRGKSADGKEWLHGSLELTHNKNNRHTGKVGKLLEVSNESKVDAGYQPRRRVPRKTWRREELMVVLNLYHKLTFGRLHSRNPAIVTLAEKLERGANSVAMKLVNLASLDPALKLRGIKGLKGASDLDRAVWNEFHADLNETVPASEDALRALFEADDGDDLEVLPKEGFRVRKRPPSGPTEISATIKQRRGQDYFRDSVLNNFGGRCGVTQLAIRELLIASHILPWGTHSEHRLNVRNGLCLSRLHDAAFDQGLIAFDENLRMEISPQLKAALPQRSITENFGAYEGTSLCLPDDAALPEPEFLAEHRAKKFRKR